LETKNLEKMMQGNATTIPRESLQAAEARASRVPPARRAYWICQFAGWVFFALYVLTGYLASTRHAAQASLAVFILLFIGGFCPLFMHAVRWWMYQHNWRSLPFSRLLARIIAAVVALAGFFSALVLLLEIPVFHLVQWGDWRVGGTIGMIVGYAVGLTVWFAIYFGVQSARRRRALETRALELQVVAHDAQLNALREQLNPHFLFNCLNGLRALILEDPPRAQTMVTRLAGLLRYSLKSNHGHTVRLEEEMIAVRDYLELEQMRFEERLRVRTDLEPQALSAHVPAMIVQTLVENALKHGISNLPEGGEVSVAARVQQGALEVSVSNPGSLAQRNDGGGVGLRNARERLRLLYGEAGSLTVAEAGSMVTATLRIPATEPTAT
jgi:hypothetical protein